MVQEELITVDFDIDSTGLAEMELLQARLNHENLADTIYDAISFINWLYEKIKKEEFKLQMVKGNTIQTLELPFKNKDEG